VNLSIPVSSPSLDQEFSMVLMTFQLQKLWL